MIYGWLIPYLCAILTVFFTGLSHAQTSGYEKQVILTLEWGNELHQIGRKTSWMGEVGPAGFTVTSNGVWIYDKPQNYLKFFSNAGELISIIELETRVDDIRTIISDENDNIWFHDTIGKRIWVFEESGELIKTINYRSDVLYANIDIIRGKPVISPGGPLIEPHLLENELYLGKPVYEGILTNIDITSIYSTSRGRATNRIYGVTSISVGSGGKVIPPKLLIISDGKTEQVEFEPDTVKNYNIITYLTEDVYGNFYLQLRPRKPEEKNLIFKYDSTLKKVATIELPERNRFSGWPIFFDSYGTIYWMKIRDENIQILKWSEK